MSTLRSSTFQLEQPDFIGDERPMPKTPRTMTSISKGKIDMSGRKPLPKGKMTRSTVATIAKYQDIEVENPDNSYNEDKEWKNEGTSQWVVIKKNKNIQMKLNFLMDRSCKVKQDLKSKRNVLMSEMRKVPGLIINELIQYYYEPHQHDLTTDTEDFDLYEKMKTFQMDDKHRLHYKNVVNELVNTEKTYIQGLDIIIDVYLDTLIGSSKKLAKELTPIKDQISLILRSHQELLKELLGALIKNGECPLIGDIIVNFSPSLEDCAKYIFNYPTYLEKITSIMDSSAISLTSKKAEDYRNSHQNCYVQNIQQYLITPIQRIPRYVLLISDLLRNISMVFGDAPRLIEAHKAIKKVATTINEKGHEYEADEKLAFVKTLLTNFTPKEIKREFICCGPMYVVNDRVSLPTVWKYFFLFSDILVVTEVIQLQGKSIKDRTETLFESLLRIPELKDLHDSKFEVEQIIRFYNDTTVEVEEDTKFVHNMFTIKENNNDLLSETISLASTMSDCSIAWFTAIKSVLKHFMTSED
ncbi:Rho guanine nucleotide exchange factor, putative [Entamoeba histolytica HM-1:IMSS-B]|uniref:Rho guanine nucleotide exchange factor, putative n=4 Tax=Entamoeba histolytica TaxID=5759 RepID=C4M6H2_ENTH1|nr:Rho guanine nucleotide exchange factor, putative [Entamoeba histolytica HM-1:IMSS]EAL45879.1 Rho guanine nucleotide exchange factor, putative [Entamoeba histolytica HM-1:IMSS]EMH76747.1 Rho guanine nucleotide exchange factor, putative [Entamoeba histolytica HM-1:IMSS-B]ENY60726.1 Rho/RAC guanine nucleotide exchange factor, putative [Entamoeba histolytica HM-1:IMSS-A]GAT97067.1 rho guanine nucleotide exchange factor putative [Entamoeba histolytica]|eukprot:XP_651265.1 Rho guanine nucleotide exchange factor, putative [Entamoeba histolytica HM-1:IMSS]